MTFTKKELTGIGITLAIVGVIFVGLKWQENMSQIPQMNNDAMTDNETGFATLPGEGSHQEDVMLALVESLAPDGEVKQLIVQDLDEGVGATATESMSATVHYVGMLKDGTQFDSSYDRGAPLTFTIGAGDVIAGLEQGVVGMKEGGTRILIIPPSLAYGNRAVGNLIPRGATLLFAVELLSVN